MIAIVNISKRVKHEGPHQYELRINQNVITTFWHRREEDLSTCLRRAAAAAEAVGIKDMIKTRKIWEVSEK